MSSVLATATIATLTRISVDRHNLVNYRSSVNRLTGVKQHLLAAPLLHSLIFCIH
jgi:hypothetical protein